MELNELKVKAFDLIALKERYLLEIEKINKELQSLVEEIKKVETNGI